MAEPIRLWWTRRWFSSLQLLSSSEVSGRESHLSSGRFSLISPAQDPPFGSKHRTYHCNINQNPPQAKANHLPQWPCPQTATTPTTSAAAGTASTYRASNKSSAK